MAEIRWGATLAVVVVLSSGCSGSDSTAAGGAGNAGGAGGAIAGSGGVAGSGGGTGGSAAAGGGGVAGGTGGAQTTGGGGAGGGTGGSATDAGQTADAADSGSSQDAGPLCITSTANGRCGPYSGYTEISGANSDPWVGQNVWNGGSVYAQTLYAYGPGNWYVTANANTHFGGVLTYPNTGFDMTGAIDSFSSITSSWNVTIPTNAQTAAWAAYDLWFNNWADEVMIQTDLTVNSAYDCTPVTTATFGAMTWHLCVFGAERVWKPGADDSHLVNQAAGTVDVRAFLVWMEQNGYLPKNSTWTAGSFGFEVCDTGGATETFKVNAFSWTAK